RPADLRADCRSDQVRDRGGGLAAGGTGPVGARAIEATGGEPEHGGPCVPRPSGGGAAGAGTGGGVAGGRRGDGALPAGAGGPRPRPAPRGLRRGPRDGPAAGGDRGDPPRGVVAGAGPGGVGRVEREGGLTVDERIAIAIEGVSKLYRDQVALDGLTLS